MIISLNSVTQLIFVMVKCGVLFETGWIIKYRLAELRLQRVNFGLFCFFLVYFY
jgi:hypothetical protein